MNDDPEPPLDPEAEAELRSLLAPLKRFEPSPSARAAFRRATFDALGPPRPMDERVRLRWWQRSISLPIPVVAAGVLVVLLTLPFGYQLGRTQTTAVMEAVRGERGQMHAERPTFSARHTAEPRPRRRQVQTETYVCGIGRVASHVYISEELP